MAFLRDLFGVGDSQKAHEFAYGQGGGYGDGYDGYQGERQAPQHKSSWTHEIVAGAAGFAAMKAYEDHVRRTGEQVSHPLMKEMLAGFAAAEVDKLFETKGLDFLDREEAKRRAVQQAHHLANEQYGPGGTFNWQGNPYGGGPGGYQQQQGGYGYGGNQFGGGAYPQQGGYGYGGNQFGGGGNQFGGGGYQQQQPGEYFGGEGEQHRGRHHHHREN